MTAAKVNGQEDPYAPVIYSAVSLATVTFPELRWVIKGFLPVGLALLAGKPKLGKSWLAFAISLAVADGKLALGSLETTKCRVLHLPFEDPGRRLQYRMNKLLKGEAVPDLLDFVENCPRIADGGLDLISNYLNIWSDCKLVVIDTWGRIRSQNEDKRSGNGNSYQAEYDEMTMLHKFAHDHGICLLLVHHTRKQESSDVYDGISGTTGISGAADTLMVMSRKRGDINATLSLTGRDIEEDGDFALTWDGLTGNWTLQGKADQFRQDTQKAAILKFVQEQGEAVSVIEVAQELGLAPNTVRISLKRLKKGGLVNNPERGKYAALNLGTD